MSNYFLLMDETTWAGPVPRRTEGPEIDLCRGRCEKLNENFEFVLEVDSQAKNPMEHPALDYQFLGASGQALFSSKFCEVLKLLGIYNIQYFDANVKYGPTGQQLDYKLANILGMVNALDTTASVCDVDEDGLVDSFELIVLNEDSLSGLDFVRFTDMMSLIIISRRIASKLKESDLTGLRILEPSEWVSGID